jgi:hypothetical protein
MATLAQISAFVEEPDFLKRFLAGRLQVAWNILAEAPPVTNRVQWANKIFTDFDADGHKEYRWWLSHSAVQASGKLITDANIVTSVASFVDAWNPAP